MIPEEEADKAEREDSPREVAARLVKLEDRCALDLRATSRDEPGIEMGEVAPARRRSVVDPSKASVVVVDDDEVVAAVLLSRLVDVEDDEGVDPPEDWLRSRRPNSVLYMVTGGGLAGDRSR